MRRIDQKKHNFIYACAFDVAIDESDLLRLTLPRPITFYNIQAANRCMYRPLKFSNRVHPLRSNSHVPFRAAKLIALSLFIAFCVLATVLIPSLLFGLKKSESGLDTNPVELVYKLASFQCYGYASNNQSIITNCSESNSCLISRIKNDSIYLNTMCNNYGIDFDVKSITRTKIVEVKYCTQSLCNDMLTLETSFSEDNCLNKTLLYPLPEVNTTGVSQCYSCSNCLTSSNSTVSIENCNFNKNLCQVEIIILFKFYFFRRKCLIR